MPSMTTVGDQGKAQCGLAERDSPPRASPEWSSLPCRGFQAAIIMKRAGLIFALLCAAYLTLGAFVGIQAHGGGTSLPTCTTNGNDGQTAAPPGTGQFSTLLAGYATSPKWCVAGVGYAVGITSNATNSGNTITETGVLNVPVSTDKRSFYAQSGGSLPSGIKQGLQYFICGVSGSGTTYSYGLSTSIGCDSMVSLGALGSGFIALKIPNSVANTPSGTSGWSGSGCGSGLTFDICITGNNVTLDHWDFSVNGGYFIFPGTIRNPTVTNNYFLIGSNFRGVFYDEGTGPTGVTFSNNIVDGNAVAIYTTTTARTTSGNQITVASTTGIVNNLTVCNITHTSSITCPGVFVSSVVGNVVTLSASVNSTVSSGDAIGFVRAPNPGNSLYQSPQISFGDRGSTIAQYNWIRNTYSEHWQQGLASGMNNTGITLKYNVFENTGWGAPITGAHGDVVQVYGASGSSFQSITLNYNTVIQNTSLASSTSTSYNILTSGVFGATATTLNSLNNTAIYSAGSKSVSTYGLMAVNPKWFSSAVNVQDNYVDPTSACNGSRLKCGNASWAAINVRAGGGTGPSTPRCTATGNVSLVTGGALPAPFGGYC